MNITSSIVDPCLATRFARLAKWLKWWRRGRSIRRSDDGHYKAR